MEPTGTKRKLSAILMADAVGYSRLMGQDETATVAAIKASREIFRAQVESRSGRIVNAPGDSILAEFGSVVDALAAAVEIQRKLAEGNQDVPTDQAMQFRVGVSLVSTIRSPRILLQFGSYESRTDCVDDRRTRRPGELGPCLDE